MTAQASSALKPVAQPVNSTPIEKAILEDYPNAFCPIYGWMKTTAKEIFAIDSAAMTDEDFYKKMKALSEGDFKRIIDFIKEKTKPVVSVYEYFKAEARAHVRAAYGIETLPSTEDAFMAGLTAGEREKVSAIDSAAAALNAANSFEDFAAAMNRLHILVGRKPAFKPPKP